MNNPTKEKLLQVANELFSVHGYGQTSIRDIASKANVNVAAVNYHFKNKETLYWETFFLAYETAEQGISKICEEESSLEEVACAVFDFLCSRSTVLRNTFKLFLTESIPLPAEDARFQELASRPGPPGSQKMAEVVRKELGLSEVTPAIHWMVLCVFSLSIHWALKSSSSLSEFGKGKKNKLQPVPDTMRQMLRHQVKASFAYIKANPNAFA